MDKVPDITTLPEFKIDPKTREEAAWCPQDGAPVLVMTLLSDPELEGGAYLGSRGGSKSNTGMLAESKYVDNPNFAGVTLRKNNTDLVNAWLPDAKRFFGYLDGEVGGKPPTVKFPSGASIFTGYTDNDGWEAHQGGNYQFLLIEDICQLPSPRPFNLLRASVRTSDPTMKPCWLVTGNPTGRGAYWVREMFVKPDPKIYDTEVKYYRHKDEVRSYQIITERSSGRKFFYVPSSTEDNEILLKSDPDYIKRLEGYKNTDPELYKAWRFGSWDTFSGAVFREFEPDKHVVPNLMTAGIESKQQFSTSVKVIGIDLGYRDPFCAQWVLFPEHTDRYKPLTIQHHVGERITYLENAPPKAVCYREWHESFVRYEEWVKRLREQLEKEPVDYIVLPHDADNHVGGQKSFRQMLYEAISDLVDAPQIISAKSLNEGSRILRQNILHSYLAIGDDGSPRLVFHVGCKNIIRSLPALVYDEKKREEVDVQTDHSLTNCYDALGYCFAGYLQRDDEDDTPQRPQTEADLLLKKSIDNLSAL